MSINVVTTQGTLGSAVADAGTFTVSYPDRAAPEVGQFNEGDFYLAMGHTLVMGNATLNFPADFDLTFGTSSITVTNQTGSSWPVGTTYRLNLNIPGKPVFRENYTGVTGGRTVKRIGRGSTFRFVVTPDVLDADGIAASQTVTGAGTAFSLNGALVSGGVAIMDVPRCIQAAWTNSAYITITGKDEYGNTIVEVSATGTSHYGTKAFAKVTSVTTSATITSATVGTTDTIGLPFFLPSRNNVLRVARDTVDLPSRVFVTENVDATRLSAGTSCWALSPYASFLERATTCVDTAIVTGGDVTFKIGGTTVVGLTCTVADSAAVGSVVTDTPTTVTGAANATNVITADRTAVEIVPAAAFNGGGALDVVLELNPWGVFTPGIRTGNGSTSTTGDVRGTFRPPVACDGDIAFEMLVSTGDPSYIGIDQYGG